MDSWTIDAAADPTFLGWALLGLMCLAAMLMLYCVFTIYRNPYFDEVHKFGWLLIALTLPIFGPLTWIVRARLEKKRHQTVADEPHEDHRERKTFAHPAYRPGQSVLFSRRSEKSTEGEKSPYLVDRGDGSRGLSF